MKTFRDTVMGEAKADDKLKVLWNKISMAKDQGGDTKKLMKDAKKEYKKVFHGGGVMQTWKTEDKWEELLGEAEMASKKCPECGSKDVSEMKGNKMKCNDCDEDYEMEDEKDEKDEMDEKMRVNIDVLISELKTLDDGALAKVFSLVLSLQD